MIWSKAKQKLEEFLNNSLAGIVEYQASGYSYVPGKKSLCYIVVNKKKIFNMKNSETNITWYENEQEVKNDNSININITSEDIDEIRTDSIPEDRLILMAKKRKLSKIAKKIYISQTNLLKTDFQKTVLKFLTDPVESSLTSDDILLNIFAISDRRIGKKRLAKMKRDFEIKHSVVKYFYDLRVNH